VMEPLCGWYLDDDKWSLMWDSNEYLVDSGDLYAYVTSDGYWKFRVWNEGCHNCMSPYIAIDGSECPVCTQRERPEGGESEEAKCECGYETNRDVMCAHSKWCPLSDDKG